MSAERAEGITVELSRNGEAPTPGTIIISRAKRYGTPYIMTGKPTMGWQAVLSTELFKAERGTWRCSIIKAVEFILEKNKGFIRDGQLRAARSRAQELQASLARQPPSEDQPPRTYVREHARPPAHVRSHVRRPPRGARTSAPMKRAPPRGADQPPAGEGAAIRPRMKRVRRRSRPPMKRAPRRGADQPPAEEGVAISRPMKRARRLLQTKSTAPEAIGQDASASFQGRPVIYVHQIYGLFGDGKPMSQRFEDSRDAWSACAGRMGARYHLWNAAQVETLMRTRYPQFWDTYQTVRYPVMRADIARIAILHAYGGLYADLDTMPNRQSYAQAPLAVCSVWGPKKGGGWKKSDWRTADQAPRKEFYDMEVLVGEVRSPFLLGWLHHVCDEIGSKDYHNKNSLWYNARMRYIYHTTGPMAMRRFLNKPENRTFMSRVSKLNMNWFKDEPKLTDQDREQFHVITVESRSYETKKHEILVPVGTQNVPIPAEPLRRRAVCKVTAPSTQLTDDQDHDAADSPLDAADSPLGKQDQDDDKKTINDLTQKIQVFTREKEEEVARRAVEDATRAQEQDRVSELKKFYATYYNTASVKTTLQQMPRKLGEYLAPWFPFALYDDDPRDAAKRRGLLQEKRETSIPAHHQDRTPSPEAPPG